MTDIPIVEVNQVEWLQSKSLGEIQGIKEGITPSGNGPRDRCPGSATDKRLVSFVICSYCGKTKLRDDNLPHLE